MKRCILMIALIGPGLLTPANTASGRDVNDYSDSRSYDRTDEYPARGDDRVGSRVFMQSGHLRHEVERLNQMSGHVRHQMRRYGANQHLWRRYSQVQSDLTQLNDRVRRDYGNRRWVKRSTDRIRRELLRIEQELRFRPGDYYRW